MTKLANYVMQPPADTYGDLVARPTAGVSVGVIGYVAETDTFYRYNGSSWVQAGKVATSSATSPTSSDDSTKGFKAGSLWVNVTTKYVYVCISAGIGAANWLPLDLDETLTFVNVPAYSANWTSTAQVAKFDNGRLAVMRGKFTSTADNNSDPCGTFPTGYEGEFSKAVSVSRSGNQERIHKETVTWSGGAATYNHPVAHILATDDVQATVKVKGTENNFAVTAACANGSVNLTAETPPVANDLIVYIEVWRDNSVFTCDMGTDGNIFGIGPNLNTGDFVWANIAYEIKQQSHVTPNLVVELNNVGVTVSGTPFQVFLENEAGTVTYNWQQLALGSNIAYGGLPAGNYTATIFPATVEGSDTNTYNSPNDFPVTVSSDGQDITFTYTQA